jgi:hypothetical protein
MKRMIVTPWMNDNLTFTLGRGQGRRTSPFFVEGFGINMSNTWMGAGVDVHVHFCRLERSYDKLELDFDSLVDSIQFNC